MQFLIHLPDSLLQRLIKRLVKQLAKIRRRHPGLIGRAHPPELFRFPPVQKIPDRLRRCKIIAAPERERRFLQPLLKFHPRQRMRRTEIPPVHINQHRRVGIFLIARIFAHAVGNHMPRQACRRHHCSPRTHTERINRTPARQMRRKLVVRRPEIRRTDVFFTVLRQIDVFLFMFNSHPDRKRFLRHIKPVLKQHLKRIARRMSERQNQRVRRNFITCAVRPLHHRRCQPPHIFRPGFFLQFQINQRFIKTVFAAKRRNPPPDISDHRRQFVRADMRLGEIQNFLRRARRNKCFQHFGREFVFFNSGHQFAIGKSPRAAFAELHVCPFAEFAGFPKTAHRPLPFADRRPALQHNRLGARLCQTQRRHHTRRPRPDNNRTHRLTAPGLVGSRGKIKPLLFRRQFKQITIRRKLSVILKRRRVNFPQAIFVPCVQRFPHDTAVAHPGAETRPHRRNNFAVIRFQRQFDIIQPIPPHLSSPFIFRRPSPHAPPHRRSLYRPPLRPLQRRHRGFFAATRATTQPP